MKTVYCSKCAFFAAYDTPWDEVIFACAAKAVVVTKGAIVPVSDVTGVLDPRKKNEHNDCGDFRRFSLATRKVLKVMDRAEGMKRVPRRKVKINYGLEEDYPEEDYSEEDDPEEDDSEGDSPGDGGEAPTEPGGKAPQPVG